MRFAFINYCVIFVCIFNYVNCARILGLFPHTGKSHQMVFEPLLRRLAENGHQLTVASFFPIENPPGNYTDISFKGISDIGLETFNLEWYESFGGIKNISFIRSIVMQLENFNILSTMALNTCKKVIALPSLNEAMRKPYDIVLMENFNSDCMWGLLHVHNIKAPVIGLSSCVLMPWSAARIGVNDNPSYVTLVTSAYTSPMTFLQRAENAIWQIYFKLWLRYSVQLKEKAFIEKQFGRQIPDLEDLGRNISLIFVNSYHAFNGVTPLAPALVEVGGMHLDQPRKLIPQECLRKIDKM